MIIKCAYCNKPSKITSFEFEKKEDTEGDWYITCNRCNETWIYTFPELEKMIGILKIKVKK